MLHSAAQVASNALRQLTVVGPVETELSVLVSTDVSTGASSRCLPFGCTLLLLIVPVLSHISCGSETLCLLTCHRSSI